MKKYTLITGAGSGIGKQFAIESAIAGENLVLVSLPDSGLIPLRKILSDRYGTDVIIVESDLTVNGEPERLYNFLQSKKVIVNRLINNAGIGYEGEFVNLSPEFCCSLTTLNMQVVVMLSRLFIPGMIIRREGLVINISSLASFAPMPFKSLYAASKTFIFSFSRALDSELRGTGVEVKVVCPGPVPTNENVKQRIRNHGLFSKLTTVSPGRVASEVYKAISDGKKVIIPGFMNRLVKLVMILVPVTIQLQLFRIRMNKK